MHEAAPYGKANHFTNLMMALDLLEHFLRQGRSLYRGFIRFHCHSRSTRRSIPYLGATMIRLALTALALLTTAAVAADAPVTAAGKFKSRDITLDVKSAVAFHGKSLLGEDRALIVAISNTKMFADAIADYVDRRRLIEQRIMDGQTGVVWLDFRLDGTFRGMSYYFVQGNGCGFCSGEVASTVKLVDGKLTGKMTDAENERSFELTLAVPVMSDDHGAALPPDGGEPGKVYMRYHEALSKGDRAVLQPLLSNGQQKYLSEAEKNGKLAAALHEMADAHPAKSVQITSGLATANKAVLLFVGEGPSTKITGEVLLVKEDGTWRVDDEIAVKQ
jgi:hypothetical protein